jgi:serine/threonine protein kinase
MVLKLVEAGDIINGCLPLFCFYNFCLFLDLIKDEIANLVFVVEKQFTKEIFIMKMINIGKEGSEQRTETQKKITQMNASMMIGQECPFLVRYWEMFYYKHFCCLIMEYCEEGDLQKQLDSGKHYEEWVSLLFYMINNNAGFTKICSSYWKRSFKTSFGKDNTW